MQTEPAQQQDETTTQEQNLSSNQTIDEQQQLQQLVQETQLPDDLEQNFANIGVRLYATGKLFNAKRESSLEQMRKQQKQKQQEQFTFKPQISKMSQALPKDAVDCYEKNFQWVTKK